MEGRGFIMDQKQNILCLHSQQKDYLIPFENMVEICTHVKISKIPCLPKYYLGVFHFKGEMLPVLQLEYQQDCSFLDVTLLVVTCESCRFGIVIDEEPLLLGFNTLDLIENKHDFMSEIWFISHLYQYKDNVYYMIDIEKTVELLIADEN